MKAGVWQFPALAVQRAMKCILVQLGPDMLMPNSFLLRTHPHREEQKVLHYIFTVSEVTNT